MMATKRISKRELKVVILLSAVAIRLGVRISKRELKAALFLPPAPKSS